MNDYKSAFNAMAADISAIIALLGFDSYPGVDPVLRAITDLVLAKAEVQQLKGERDVALAEVAHLHNMLGVTDQMQAGERLGFLVGQSIMVPKLEAKLTALAQQEPIGWWAQYCETPMRRMVHWGPKLPKCATDRFYPVYAAPVAQAGQVPDALREGFMTSCSGGGKYEVKIQFSNLKDAQKSHNFLVKLLAAAPAQGE